MADAGLFIGWGAVVRGREAASLEVFQETLGFLGQQQEAGNVESFEPVFLEPHGGDLAGFILVRGDAGKLATMRVSDEFAKLTLRAGFIVDGLGVVGADIGARLQEQMEYYAGQIASFS